MVEQLICNQQVIGSTPVPGSERIEEIVPNHMGSSLVLGEWTTCAILVVQVPNSTREGVVYEEVFCGLGDSGSVVESEARLDAVRRPHPYRLP